MGRRCLPADSMGALSPGSESSMSMGDEGPIGDEGDGLVFGTAKRAGAMVNGLGVGVDPDDMVVDLISRRVKELVMIDEIIGGS